MGIDRHHLRKVGDGPVVVAPHGVDEAAHVVRLGIAAVPLDRHGEIGLG